MFKIKFSRHAKRRLSLYDISEETIVDLIERHLSYEKIMDGTHELVDNRPFKHDYPLKTVFSLKKNEITVITAYPLKKGLKV
jgi:hypothetical protein